MAEIERFFLYGEAPRPAGERFVHLEFLDDRSRPANWTIRPHAHSDLHHIFLVEGGGGAAEADGRMVPFAAPCVVIVPSGAVHGFRWKEDSVGRVLTFSEAILRVLAAREPDIATSFADGLWSASVAMQPLQDLMRLLLRELGWAAPGHDLSVEAHLSAILVEVLRLQHVERQIAHAPIGPDALLVARFRELVEARFREHLSVSMCARALGVSPTRLRVACQNAAGASPSQIAHERILLEARRLMRYSNMSISQIALYMGFADPAYFSRFFARETGQSPRAFRQTVRGAPREL